MYVSADNMREEKGKIIAYKDGCIIRVDDTHYMVKSQSHKGFLRWMRRRSDGGATALTTLTGE